MKFSYGVVALHGENWAKITKNRKKRSPEKKCSGHREILLTVNSPSLGLQFVHTTFFRISFAKGTFWALKSKGEQLLFEQLLSVGLSNFNFKVRKWKLIKLPFKWIPWSSNSISGWHFMIKNVRTRVFGFWHHRLTWPHLMAPKLANWAPIELLFCICVKKMSINNP